MAKILGIIDLFNSPDCGLLTSNRTLASTTFLGRFAPIDFPLSNFTNSKIDEINILVEKNFRSINKHVGSMKSWVNNTKIARQNLLINEAEMTSSSGNTDIACLAANDWILYEANAEYVVIQPSHVLFNFDFRPMIKDLIKTNGDVSLLVTKLNGDLNNFEKANVVEINEDNSFKILNKEKTEGCYVSMQSYVLAIKVVKEILEKHKDKSFDDVISWLINNNLVKASIWEYKGYSKSLDSFKSFMDASLEMLNREKANLLFDPAQPIFTLTHDTPPALYGENADVKNSIVANGSIIDGRVENSIISRRVKIGEGSTVNNSVIFTRTNIGKNVHLENVLIDKYCDISDGVSIKGEKDNPTYISQGKRL